jgi:putative transposase
MSSNAQRMTRKYLIRSNEHPYHVTARGNNREPYPCGQKVAWEIFCTHLKAICELFDVKIHAFVMMPNHFHLLITTSKEDLGEVMQWFMRSVTRTINDQTGRSGRIFGGRYHWSIVRTQVYYDCALKYIYRNPVKAGMIKNVEDFAFSTIKHALEIESLDYPLSPPIWADSIIPKGQKTEFLLWLNQSFKESKEAAIKAGLRKTTFTPPRAGWQKMTMDLDEESFSF